MCVSWLCNMLYGTGIICCGRARDTSQKSRNRASNLERRRTPLCFGARSANSSYVYNLRAHVTHASYVSFVFDILLRQFIELWPRLIAKKYGAVTRLYWLLMFLSNTVRIVLFLFAYAPQNLFIWQIFSCEPHGAVTFQCLFFFSFD